MVKNIATQSSEIVHALIAKGESKHTVENRCAPQCIPANSHALGVSLTPAHACGPISHA